MPPSCTYKHVSWTRPDGTEHSTPVAAAVFEDGVEIALVGIDREENLRFEYRSPRFSVQFFARTDIEETATGFKITYLVFKQLLFVNDNYVLTPPDWDALWMAVKAALRRWPHDWYADDLTADNPVKFLRLDGTPDD